MRSTLVVAGRALGSGLDTPFTRAGVTLPAAYLKGQVMHRSKYTTAEGLSIVLEVPEPTMGRGSGFIPPPALEFRKEGRPVTFFYEGEE